MKGNVISMLLVGAIILVTGCSQESILDESLKTESSVLKVGATRISGIGYYAEISECDYVSEGADFAFTLEGDLEGCWYVFVEDYECSPSGTYRESGTEYFVGTYKGESGTFWTTYKFEAKFDGCEDGFFVGAEIFGRCQHPIQSGSGTGVFEGATGRVDFKDDIEAGNFPYRGHIRY